ncbi:MAG: TadE family protein [Alsobacter sp.]
MVEFAAVLPVFALLIIGGMQLTLMLENYTVLSDAARAGARQFSVSRISTTPYTDTITQITTTASTLNPTNISTTLTVNGVVCTNNLSCQSALAPARGLPLKVSLSYPCLKIVYLIKVTTPCSMSAAISERVE